MSKSHVPVLEGLTSEQFAKLTKVSKDPFFFSTFVNIIHPMRGKVQFKLYPFQISVLWWFLKERFNIVLKFRQAGITELIAMYCLWLAMYHPNKNVQIISIKDRVAKKVLRRIKYMYKHLPLYLQVPIVNGRKTEYGTATEIEFANGSTITSIPTTEDAGRSEAASLLVIDEGAIIRWAGKIWAAAFPTLSTGGSSIVNSTPYGTGNWFHKTWVDACSGGNNFNPIRLRWDMHPERDLAWYTEMRNQMGERRTAQEIDGDFLTSGFSVFNLMDIRGIEEDIEDSMVELQYEGRLRIYNRPIKGAKYYMGADIATGRAKDYSAFSVMSRDGLEMASFKGKIDTFEFAELMMRVGKEYNFAELAPESNDIGLAVTRKIQEERYPNLYMTKRLLKKKGKHKPEESDIPGWYTTRANRPIIIDKLEEDIRLENVTILDPEFTREAYTFIYDSQNRPVASGKNKSDDEDDMDDDSPAYSDDAIMAKAITNFIRQGKVKGIIVNPV
jgi:vacuolar-type H+-ATPase subunit F/Vma7